MKWLNSAGCPWNENTVIEAVKYGYLNNIRWFEESFRGSVENRLQLECQC